MENSVKGAAKRLSFSLLVAASLGGCAVYDAGYGYPYYTDPVYYPTAPAYGYGMAPLYTAPPFYVPPPVLQFNYRSGGGHGGRGWHDGGHRWHNNGGRWHGGQGWQGNGRGSRPGGGGFRGHH
jgi:hypothetical protein